MKAYKIVFTSVLCFIPFVLHAQPQHFDTSLHKTSKGKEYFYSSEQGGIDSLLHIPYETFKCTDCHGETLADGTPVESDTYTPGCQDCHAQVGDTPKEEVCFNCHVSSFPYEERLGYTDFHREEYGMTCWDCHSTEDIHGDGTTYNSMFEAGAVDAACENCHDPLSENPEHIQHQADIHCASCHTQASFMCANCHVNSLTEGGQWRTVTMRKDYLMLGRRTKDQKVYPVNFQQFQYTTPAGKDETFALFFPSYAHGLRKDGRVCEECHGNNHMQAYAESHKVLLSKWHPDTHELETPTGVLPFPFDYDSSLQFNYMKYTGKLDSPDTDPTKWEVATEETTRFQLMFVQPLSEEDLTELAIPRKREQ